MFSDDDSTVYLTDQLSAFGQQIHYMFEVPDSTAFLQGWLGEEDAHKVLQHTIPVTLMFRDNDYFTHDKVNIVTIGMVGLPAWDGLEQDAPEVQRFIRQNRFGTQSYFVHDTSKIRFFDSRADQSSVLDQYVFMFRDELLELEYNPIDIENVRYISGVHESSGANMIVNLYDIAEIGATYVMLSPITNGMVELQGKDGLKKSESERNEIKHQNELKAINLMHKFCHDGLLVPMTEMPLQFIKNRLQSSPAIN
ncbi:MAG TPA: hypothetical protein VGF14_05575 [Alphaproteobacteria bacterium]